MSGEEKFKAEYAKSGRSACNKCKKFVEKGLLRIAHMVQVARRNLNNITKK